MNKNYIKLLSFVVLLVIGVHGVAQDVQNDLLEVPLSNPGDPGKLSVWVLYGSINISTHSGDKVIINSSRDREDRKAQFKDGLRKISNGSSQFSVEEYDNKIIIRSGHGNSPIDFDIKVPKNFSLELKATNKGDINVEGVEGEMEISNTNGAITLHNVGGSVIADALNKDITVTFTNVTNNAPMAFTSLNGDLNISFPAGLKASLKAKTEYGDIYTDFELEQDMSSETNTDKRASSGVYKVTVDKWVKGKINGGGAEILFKTLNGDILIRKQ